MKFCKGGSKLLPKSRAHNCYQTFCNAASDFQLTRHLSSPGSNFYLTIHTKWSHKTQWKWYQWWLLLHRFWLRYFWWKIIEDALKFLRFDSDNILKPYLLTFLVPIFEQFMKPAAAGEARRKAVAAGGGSLRGRRRWRLKYIIKWRRKSQMLKFISSISRL